MKKIKLRYVDTMSKNYHNEVLWKLLNQWYDIDSDSEPDYVISGGMGTSFTKFKDSILIQIIGENITPDFNVFDYAIGFDNIQFDDRYVRIPLYVFYDSYQRMLIENKVIDKDTACKRNFCSFVVSNARNADPIRDHFFKLLCTYKKVDSAGRHLNNIGGGYLKDKLEFISHYKFNIAFENCSSNGYTTEKIMEPMSVGTIPIYWGNPVIGDDFNKDSFICLSDYDSVEDCIEYIKKLDNDDELYYEKLCQPWFRQNIDEGFNNKLRRFFDNIFSQEISSARRVNKYGKQSEVKLQLCNFYKSSSRIVYTDLLFYKIPKYVLGILKR